MCEKTLIREVQSDKNENSFVELISLHQKDLSNYLRNRFHSYPIDYQEVYNKVLLKIWMNISLFRGGSSFKTWAFQIARNSVSDEFNKINKSLSRDVQLNDEIVDNVKPPDAQILDRELSDRTLEKIQKIKGLLNAKQKKVFELVFENGSSYKEASQILNCSLGTVMSRVFYTRKKIQEIVKTHELRDSY